MVDAKQNTGQVNRKPRVVVAMSGGVDSSVAAALLVEKCYEVIGMMMRLWSEPGMESHNRCCTPDSMALARRVAAKLGIPFYAVDAKQVFHDTVVKTFTDGYAQGITPNPCLVCNRHIRWEFLLERALAMGADYMATGHYTRLRRDENGKVQILRAVDAHKDQSYVLHVLGQEQLRRARFPVGEYTKARIREMAQEFDLPVADRADSQDLCFLGDGNYREFLLRNSPEVAQAGPITTRDGEVVGQHQGLAFYTIGQRKGLGIAAPHPLYVLDKDRRRNALVVGKRDELGSQKLVTQDTNWVSGEKPADSFRAQVKVRYTAREAWARVTPLKDRRTQVDFDEPVRDITPGQAAVFYEGEVLLGGGIIEEAGN